MSYPIHFEMVRQAQQKPPSVRREVQDKKVLGTKQGHEEGLVMKALFTQMYKKAV